MFYKIVENIECKFYEKLTDIETAELIVKDKNQNIVYTVIYNTQQLDLTNYETAYVLQLSNATADRELTINSIEFASINSDIKEVLAGFYAVSVGENLIEQIKNISADGTTEFNFYFNRQQIQVTFVGNGGLYEGSDQTQKTFTFGKEEPYECPFELEESYFTGWSTDKNGDGKGFDADELIKSHDNMTDSVLYETLYANFDCTWTRSKT